MTSWIKVVPIEEVQPDKLYFFGRTFQGRSYDFWSRWKNGREAFSSKPGIAMRFPGTETFKRDMLKNKPKEKEYRCQFVAIEVPANADKMWRARK